MNEQDDASLRIYRSVVIAKLTYASSDCLVSTIQSPMLPIVSD